LISLRSDYRETLLRHLTENSIDLALMGKPPEGYDLAAQPFLDNPLVVIAATTHPLANAKHIPLAQLAEQPLIGRESGSGTRSTLENFLAEHDYVYKAAMEMNKNEAIKQAVEAGLGLGVVSLHTVQAELASGRLGVLDVQGFPLKRQWYLVQRQGKRPSSATQAFMELVLKEAVRLTS
jgi:DNA-binding transcriptional LysR family regulator